MVKEFSAWLRYDEPVFPGQEWRDYLRAFGVKWARTKSTEDVPIWYAIEGKGYVVWVSEPQWSDYHWRIILAVAASAAPIGSPVIEEIVSSAVERFPAMRIEKPLEQVAG